MLPSCSLFQPHAWSPCPGSCAIEAPVLSFLWPLPSSLGKKFERPREELSNVHRFLSRLRYALSDWDPRILCPIKPQVLSTCHVGLSPRPWTVATGGHLWECGWSSMCQLGWLCGCPGGPGWCRAERGGEQGCQLGAKRLHLSCCPGPRKW